MRTELPEFKRCCFCFPLRYGLLAWGYFMLTLTTLLIIFFSITLYQVIVMLVEYRVPIYMTHAIAISVIVAILLVDAVLDVIFIVGAHKKNAELLNVYYYYGIVVWVLSAILGILATGLTINHVSANFTKDHVLLLVSDLATLCVNLVVQLYIILLVRSEMNKLDSVGQFKFVNNAAEAECVMEINDLYIAKETENEMYNKKHEKEDYNDTRVCVKANSCCKNTGQCKVIQDGH